MEEDKLLDELDKIRKDLQNHHLMLQMLVAGGAETNKRIQALESFIVTVASLTQMVSKMLERHLSMFDQTGKFPEGKDTPVKKESHPEFG